ncbi:uncharacterized protein [Watersipora subatra]|uniref:uncharacterized protein isoform X2 n=1 Tax=Watersipora subatra TaxID=2589382 RepID=UPI00355B8A3D
MDPKLRAGSQDEIGYVSDGSDSTSTSKVKVKRPGMLGKLKDRIFGHKKKRTRSHETASRRAAEEEESADSCRPASANELTAQGKERLADTTYPSSEGIDLPKTNMVATKNTSASLEALTSSKIKSELERKLVNRRSMDDDGLPGSPMGTPTNDIMSQSNFLKKSKQKGSDFQRDRDSDGSLLSIGSSENEEDAFFKNPWKGAYTSAIRRPRHGTLSSDSEPEDSFDFDVVGKTENLSNSAAMHKRNVRPRHRNKTRRVTAATGQMPSLAEKKTLEIAHTFLDDGDKLPVKIRNTDTVTPSVTLRRTESGRAYGSPIDQRKSDPNVVNTNKKSPKPVARSSTTAANLPSRNLHGEQKAHEGELLSVLQRLRIQSPSANTQSSPDTPQDSLEAKVQSVGVTASNTLDAAEELQAKPPPRPAKSVGFAGSPPLQRRAKAPAVQPRPKSMIPAGRSRTQEVKSSNVEEALSNLSYSKSFHASETKRSGDGLLRSKPTNEEATESSLPEWAKLAKRKTQAVASANDEPSNHESSSSSLSSQPPALPAKPTGSADRPLSGSSQQMTDIAHELRSKPTQASVQSDSVCNSLHGASETSKPVPQDIENKPLLYGAKVQPMASERGPEGSGSRKTPYDNVVFNQQAEVKTNKESIILHKSKPVVMPAYGSGDNDSPPPVVDPPWKASLKLRTGSQKTPPAADGPQTPRKPAWKSATVKEKAIPSMSTSSEGLEEILSAQNKNTARESDCSKVDRMAVSETSAYPPESPDAGEEPKSFRDRLKMFQSH